MNIYVTLDLNKLMQDLSDKELYKFMLKTFRDRVPDEYQVSLITEMFKVMFDSNQEDALVAILKDMSEVSSSFVIKEYFESISLKHLNYYKNIIKDLQEN